MYPKNQFLDLIEKELKNLNLTNVKTFTYSPNPEVLTGEIEKLTNYAQRKRNLKQRRLFLKLPRKFNNFYRFF